MSQPIIVGFDGSERGSEALVLGRALAETLAADLVVVIAYTPEQSLWAPGTAEPIDANEREQVVKRAEAALSDFGRLEVRTVASPSAAGALHVEAERERAKVIVVGSTHRGPMGRLLLGTVTQEVIDAAPCAVAVAPTGLGTGRALRFSKVGVGFDDTPAAYDALEVARFLAHAAQAELHLIWAAQLVARALPLAATGYLQPNYYAEVRAGVEERLERAAAPIREDMVVRTSIVGGGTTDALLEQSDHLDLLVLGSRGYGPVQRVLLGSVSKSVVNAARCPVLLVPRGIRTLDEAQQPAESAEVRGE